MSSDFKGEEWSREIYLARPARDLPVGCPEKSGALPGRAPDARPEFPREDSSNSVIHEQPLVAPQVLHFRQVPLRTSVKLPHSPQGSPS